MYGVGMARRTGSLIRGRRYPASTRWLLFALLLAGVALLTLLVHIFAPQSALQVVALGLTGCSFIAMWLAILVWRMPVFSRSTLWIFTAVWFAGLALAIGLVVMASRLNHEVGLGLAVQWLAFSISLCVGGLEFRALFNRRATPILGRSLSLLSPMIVLILILVNALNVT